MQNGRWCRGKWLPTSDWLQTVYWDFGWSFKRIAEECRRPYGTVAWWFSSGGIPVRDPKMLRRAAGVRPINLSDDVAVAYLLGIIEGDGSVFAHPLGRQYNVTLEIAGYDRAFADSFADALRRIGLRPTYFGRQQKIGARTVGVQGKSVLFVKWWQGLGFDGVRRYVSESRERTVAFLRGFYESEGSCSHDKRPGRSLCVWFSNGDEELLLFVRGLLANIGYNFGMSRMAGRKPGYLPRLTLYLGARGEAQRFLTEVRPSIKTEPRRKGYRVSWVSSVASALPGALESPPSPPVGVASP